MNTTLLMAEGIAILLAAVVAGCVLCVMFEHYHRRQLRQHHRAEVLQLRPLRR